MQLTTSKIYFVNTRHINRLRNSLIRLIHSYPSKRVHIQRQKMYDTQTWESWLKHHSPLHPDAYIKQTTGNLALEAILSCSLRLLTEEDVKNSLGINDPEVIHSITTMANTIISDIEEQVLRAIGYND